MTQRLASAACFLALVATLASAVCAWLVLLAVAEDPSGVLSGSMAGTVSVSTLFVALPTSIGLLVTLPVGGVTLQRRVHGPLCLAGLACALGAGAALSLLAARV